MNTGRTRWKKGQSGNPNGKPKDTFGVFLRQKKGLSQELYDAIHPLLKSKDEAIVLKAAEFLRDSRDGKPAQMIDTPDEGNLARMLLVRAEGAL